MPKTSHNQTPQDLPVIAIVGRPNVGKSTLFNRLVGQRLAITSPIAGTTRDRIYHHVDFHDLSAIMVDTGGMEYGKKENIEADVQSQVQIAIAEADLIFFVIDAKEGLTRNDTEAAAILRKSKKEILFIANKIDSKLGRDQLAEYYELGFGEPIGISAYHNMGVDELIDKVGKHLKKMGFKKREETFEKPPGIQVCFVGKPNVGKSSLVNALLGKPQVIVSDIPGTTRDSVDIQVTWQEHEYNLIDTAGLRRRGKIERGLEKISTFRSLQAIERADIVCLLIDYSEGVRKQDQHVASYVLEAAKGLILVVNKIDLMEDRQKDETKMVNILRRRFEFLPWAPVIFISALKNTHLTKIFELADQIQSERMRKVDDEELDGFMKDIVYKNSPPSVHNTKPRFFGLKQTDVNPPTFTYFVNDPTAIHFSYRRYLENELRQKYGFTGTCMKIVFKKNVRR